MLQFELVNLVSRCENFIYAEVIFCTLSGVKLIQVSANKLWKLKIIYFHSKLIESTSTLYNTAKLEYSLKSFYVDLLYILINILLATILCQSRSHFFQRI